MSYVSDCWLTPDDVVRFKAKAAKGDGCWNWTASVDSNGYGQFMMQGVLVRAPRVAWTLRHGQIPGDLFVCHKCDNRRCVRPSHLFLGTALDNNRDTVRKGRFRGAGPRGEANGKALLTPALVLKARAFKAAGLTYDQIVKRMGFERATLAYAIRGDTWGWVK